MPVAPSTDADPSVEPPTFSDAVREKIASFTGVELAIIALALTLPLAYHDSFLIAAWTPRMALLLFALPIGTFLLLADARHGDAGSIAGVGFLAACALSTLINGAPRWVLHGGFGRESSLAYLLGLFAIWAIAKRASADATTFAIGAIGVGLVINGAIGVLQVIVKPGSGALAMLGSRPSALLSNPVYFGACLAAAAVWTAHMAGRERLGERSAFIALSFFAMCVSLSGSRIATAAALVGVGAALVYASRRARWHIVLGCVLGTGAGIVVTAATGSRGLTERAGSQLDGRLDIWIYAWRAFLDRPLRGYGLGQFRAAVQPYFEPGFVARHADTGVEQSWPDAHNLIVQYTVIGGLPAILLLAGFTYAVARNSRGPLAWAGLTIAITWLFQPVQLATGPLAMLLLGLAAAPVFRAADETGDDTARAHTPVALLMLLGMLLAASLIGLDNRLYAALDRNDVDAFTDWSRIALDDPQLATKVASLNDLTGRDAVALAWSETAVRLEPFDAAQLSLLALRQLRAGDEDTALRLIRDALEVDPWHPEAIQNAQAIASATGDAELAIESNHRWCVLVQFGDPAGCSN